MEWNIFGPLIYKKSQLALICAWKKELKIHTFLLAFTSGPHTSVRFSSRSGERGCLWTQTKGLDEKGSNLVNHSHTRSPCQTSGHLEASGQWTIVQFSSRNVGRWSPNQRHGDEFAITVLWSPASEGLWFDLNARLEKELVCNLV